MNYEKGKTYISILLIKWLFNESLSDNRLTEKISENPHKPPKKVFFVVNTISLLKQQAKVIEKQTLLNVGKYYGKNGGKFTMSPDKWEKEFKKNDVFVIISKILLENLRHGMMKINDIDLLIFDECHHAQDNCDYNNIMREFYFLYFFY